jgi:hypothetical protein
MKTIRIANGQGYWGDWLEGPRIQVEKGPIDYLVMDYLAEVTMSIMQKQKTKNPELGYARDFIQMIDGLLPKIVDKGIKVITNAGGVNPQACQQALIEVAKKHGYNDLKVGIVAGDDILNDIDRLVADGHPLKNMENGQDLAEIKDRIYSANVYLGAKPIVEALDQGAQIIVTGRCTDTSITLAPMVHEFGWSFAEVDKIATGIVAGHILECGAQGSGGNFQGGWEDVDDFIEIGYPIAEVREDGDLVITKHQKTGGVVNIAMIKEQLLYELGDPKNYISPEVVVDFTSIHLHEDGPNRVRVTDIKGEAETPFYKVSVSYADGYTCIGQMTYAWPNAAAKAKAADTIVRGRLKMLGLEFAEIHTEYLGLNACHGPLSHPIDDPNEVVLKIGVRGKDYKAVERFGREIVPLVLTGPPTVTGFGAGRPKPSEVVAYWPALIKKDAINPIVEVRSAQ